MDDYAAVTLDPKSLDENVSNVYDNFMEWEEEEEEIEEMPKTKKKMNPAATRVKWSKQEEKEVKEYFSDCYKSKTLPGMKMCLRLIESNKKAGGVLWKRKWETIKKKIWNDLKRLK